MDKFDDSLEDPSDAYPIERETDDADLPELTAYEGEAETPAHAEIRAIAELSNYLEYEVGADPRRIHIRVKHGNVHLQGSVATEEQLKMIEEDLPQRPGVRALTSHLKVRED